MGLRTPPLRKRSQSKIKVIGQATTCNTLIISCNFNISHFLTCQKTLGKRNQTAKNTLKRSFFINLGTPPCRPKSQSKLKTIENTNACAILFISFKSSISYSLTCPKTWRKRPKLLKLLKFQNSS